MILKLCAATALLLAPAALAAQTTDSGYERVSVPGKHIVALRPAERQQARMIACHPDATKAVACHASNLTSRADAAARVENDRRLAER